MKTPRRTAGKKHDQKILAVPEIMQGNQQPDAFQRHRKNSRRKERNFQGRRFFKQKEYPEKGGGASGRQQQDGAERGIKTVRKNRQIRERKQAHRVLRLSCAGRNAQHNKSRRCKQGKQAGEQDACFDEPVSCCDGHTRGLYHVPGGLETGERQGISGFPCGALLPAVDCGHEKIGYRFTGGRFGILHGREPGG